jgi:hypothetical protein
MAFFISGTEKSHAQSYRSHQPEGRRWKTTAACVFNEPPRQGKNMKIISESSLASYACATLKELEMV